MPAPTTGAAEGGPPRTELQELQLKAGQTTDEVSQKREIHIRTHVYMCVAICRDSHEDLYDAGTATNCEVKFSDYWLIRTRETNILSVHFRGDVKIHDNPNAKFLFCSCILIIY